MKADIFRYNLPKEKIAKYPPRQRGSTKLLVFDRKTENIEHKHYFDIVEYINEGDVVVLNETMVEKMRTSFLTKESKRVEILFLHPEQNNNWFVLIGNARYVKDGYELSAEEDSSIKIKILRKEDKRYLISILDNIKPEDIFRRIGHTPLPPYIKREDIEEDEIRYNTIFGQKTGSSAAPTASLNLTEDMLNRIKEKGAQIVKVELKVGLGTFSPLRVDNIEDHNMHEEYISISKESAEIINEGKSEGRNIWTFGTTVVRALESVVNDKGKVSEFSGNTKLYIYPGYDFKIVDHLVTNFHQPDSSLILLVSAFTSISSVKKLYNIALENNYKFLSYGDSMLIL